MTERTLMACRPVDANDFPEDMRDIVNAIESEAPSNEHWTRATCEQCGMNILMGPRQRTLYDLDPTSMEVMDFLCAIKASKGDHTTEHLGGN